MAYVGAAIGGASLISGLVSSNKAGKSADRQNELTGEQIALQREQLGLERTRDQRALDITRKNNISLGMRQRSSDDIFQSLIRDVKTMDPMAGVSGALSTLEGEAGIARKSLRTSLGGGASRAKSGALDLATNRARAQLTNTITSNNLMRRQQMLTSLGGPVSLQTPGALTSGGAAGNLASTFGAQADAYGNQANAFRAVSGQLTNQGANLLFDAYKRYSPSNPATVNNSFGVLQSQQNVPAIVGPPSPA